MKRRPWDKPTPGRHKVMTASDKHSKHAALCTCGWERFDFPTRREADDAAVQHLTDIHAGS